jgi:hypothetical protein
MVQRLTFTRASQFAPIAERLEVSVSQGKRLGDHVRAIHVAVPEQEDYDNDTNNDDDPNRPLVLHANNDLVRTLCQATRLRSFAMKNVCRPSFLAVLCLLPSGNSIQKLDIVLNNIAYLPRETLHAVPENLNRLQSLRELRISCYDDWPQADTPALCLPRLRRFTFEVHYTNQGAGMPFLDRSDIRDLFEFEIQVWDDALIMPEGIHAIRRFINKLHQLQCLTLGIDEIQRNELLPLLSSRPLILDFTRNFIDEETVPLLPFFVHTLRISADINKVDDLIWGVLGRLAIEPTGVRTISIYLWESGAPIPFLWTVGITAMRNPSGVAASNLAIFTGRLLTHSSELSAKGIKILDDRGRTASMRLFDA